LDIKPVESVEGLEDIVDLIKTHNINEGMIGLTLLESVRNIKLAHVLQQNYEIAAKARDVEKTLERILTENP